MTWIDDIKPPYGTVTGRFVQVQWDSADDDLLPDVQPLNGTVTLTPTTPAGHIAKTFSAIAPVTARILGGEIVDQDETPGIRILSTDADLGIDDWAWKATFHLDADVDIKPFTFKLAAGDTVCLTDGLIPIASTPVQIMRGRQGASIVGGEDMGDGTVRYALDDGTFTDPVPLPPGPAGPATTLTIGTVDTGPEADATITGEAPHQTLSLVLPAGPQGAPGTAELTESDPGVWVATEGTPTVTIEQYEALAARVAALEEGAS